MEVQLAGVGGTSTGGSDYDAVSETVRFQVSDFAAAMVDGQPRYQAEWTHDVVIHDDDVVEGDETLVLEMSPTPAFLLIHTLHGGHDAVRATLTIVDNDVLPNVAPSFTSPETFTPEENQTTVGTVAASDDDTGDDITGYALSGGADQALFAIDGTTGALTFLTAPDYEDPQDADTDNAYVVEVQATSGTGDRVQMAPQTITVTVTNADEGQSGTVSIDDTAPMVGDELTASTADVADPDGLPDPFEPTWQWYRTPAGGAEAEISGAASATYTVVEADLGAALTAKASWTDLGGFANTLASAATSAVTAPLPELSVADGSATEGSPVTFTVTLSAAAAENVTVNWATSVETGDTAIAGTDFTAVPAATLTFMPSDTTQTVTVQTTVDSTGEDKETFTVTLSSPSSNATLAADPTATGTIVDGDAPNAAPTAAAGTVTTDEDTAYAFDASDFGFADTDTGDGLASVRVVTLPGSGTLAVSGRAVSADQEVAASDLGGNLTYTPAEDEHGSGYASFTFRVSDGTAESASTYTMTIDVTPVNDAPSAGTVTIDDTAPVVGDELTATAAGIADPDGLPAALLLSWQWYGTPAGGSETEIAGATAATYRVREDDAGAALTAKATYQDSDGFANTLASARTGAVGRSPVLSVGDASETEGQTVTFTVRLTAESGREVTVDWAASAESGDTAGSGDFTAVPATTLTFTAGQTEKTVTVSTTEDTADEYDETFTLTLSDATNATLAADATATGTIRDDDDPPGVRVTDASASEGEDVKFEVTLTAASGKTVNLSWELSVNNVPAEAADFASFPQDGVMTFGAGDTKKTIAVATAEDTTDEDDETFEVLILPDSSVDLLGSLTATGTIEDDDDPPTLGVANVSAIEGSDVTFTVRLLAASGREVTVDWAASAETGDTAGSGDFTAANGGLTFTAGQTEKMVTVSTTEDTTDEENETFTLRLSNASNATLPDPATATATIDDDDGAPVLSVGNASATEGRAVSFEVTLTVASTQRVTVDAATAVEGGDTAVSGTDFTAVRTALTFTAGQTEKTVTVSTSEDTTDEENETFTLRLSNATNATLATNPTARGTIDDDDPEPSLSVDPASATEGQAVTFTVRLTAASGKQVMVDWAASVETGDTAGSGDFTTVSATTLTFRAGQTEKTVTVSTSEDTTDEENETFTLRLSNATNATLATNPTARGTIDDDDPEPSLSVDPASATEGQAVTFTVRLTAASGKQVTVDWAASAESGDTAGSGDFTAVSATTLTFRAGQTEKTVTVSTTEDTLDEENETFTVRLSNATNATLATDPTATGTIDDDVGAPNAAPTAADGTVTTDEDTAYAFDASDFGFADADTDDELASVRVVTLPGSGTLAVSGSAVSVDQEVAASDLGGNLTYTPAADGHGSGYASFTFRVSDGTAESAADYTMTIDVNAVNDAPTVASALPDRSATVGEEFSYQVPEDAFSDVDGDTLSYAAAQDDDSALPEWLSFDATTRTFTGTAAAEDTGTVTVQVTASDGNGETASTTFALEVTAAANTVPTAADATVTTAEDTAHAFEASDFGFADADTDDELASVRVVTLPGSGTLAVSGSAVSAGQEVAASDLGGNLTYTPAADEHGSGYASFTFRVSDGTAESAADYTMTIDVTPVNDTPTAADGTVTTDEDTAYAFGASDFGFVDTDAGDGLASVRVVTLPGSGTLAVSGSAVSADQEVAVSDLGGNLTFTPAADEHGSGYASFTFRVSDGSAESAADYTMTIDVSAVNDAPTAADGTVTTDEDSAYAFEASDFGFADADAGDGLASVRVVTLPGSGTLAVSGAAVSADQEVAASNLGGNLTFTPAADGHGSGYASFTFRVSDGTAESAADYTMTIDVNAVNDAPTAADQTVTTDEDTAYAFGASDFGFADTDTGDELASVRVVTLPGKGTLAVSGSAVSADQEVAVSDLGGNLTFTPAADGHGSGYASFTFRVSDGSAESAADYTMTIDVNAVNDAPTAAAGTVTTDEDTAYAFGASDFGFVDTDE